MKKNSLAKVFAILALIGIVISVVGTGVLVLLSPNEEVQTYTAEELKDLIRISTGTTSTGEIDMPSLISSGSIEGDNKMVTNSGELIIETNETNSGETK